VTTVTYSLPLLGSGFQRRTFRFLSSPTILGLSYHLLTATAHNDSPRNYLIHSPTNQVTNSTDHLNSALTILPITSWHGPHRKYRSPVTVYGSLPSNGCCIVFRYRFASSQAFVDYAEIEHDNPVLSQSLPRPSINSCRFINSNLHFV
jgi:hypothetical protein